MIIKPDRRWLSKQFMILGTINVLLALVAGIVHLSVIAFDDVDTDLVATIVWGVAGGLTILMWLIATPAAVSWFRNLEYEVESNRIVVRKGILTKVQQNIPLGMVTDFRLQRTLYDRMLGIGSIQIQTAGQSVTATGYEGKLAGLADWKDLHESLRRRIRTFDLGTDGDTEPTGLDAVIAELREIRRLLEARSMVAAE